MCLPDKLSSSPTMQLHSHITLPESGRVRVRYPQSRDREGLLALLERVGLRAAVLDVERLLRFDPRLRAVVVATRWSPSGGEEVVGVGAIGFTSDAPDLLVTDPQRAPGLAAVLADVLDEAAAARRAA